MKRINPIILVAAICGCQNPGADGNEGDEAALSGDEPCQYSEDPLGPDDLTPWGTRVADDMAGLEMPVMGTWTWGPTIDELMIEQADVQTPATVTFVHEPASVRYSEHVSGGDGVACWGPRVLVDGTLTITDDQGAIITSIPITAERDQTASLTYGANPEISPVSDFSDELHVLQTWDIMRVVGFITWLEDGGLSILFNYNGQSMIGENTGSVVITRVGEFM